MKALSGILNKFLSPPVFLEDELKTQRAGNLHTLLLAFLAASLAYFLLVPVAWDTYQRRAALLGGFIASLLFVGVLNHKGKVHVACWALLASLYGLLLFAAATRGGLGALAFTALIFAVFAAGLLLGPRHALGMALLSIATGMGLYIAQRAGALSGIGTPYDIRVLLLTHCIFFLVSAAFVALGRYSPSRALQAVRKEMEAKILAQHELRRNVDQYRSLVTALAEGVVMQDDKGKIIASNESAERILGLTRDELENRSSMDPRWKAVREDGSDFPGSEHPAMVALRTGQAQTNVIMGVSKPDGTLSWISINAQPVHGSSGGGPQAVVSSFHDITRIKLAEAERKNSEEWLMLALESARMGIWSWNVPTGRVDWSPRVEKIFGLAPGSFSGGFDIYMDMVHPEDLERVRKELSAQLESAGDELEIAHRLKTTHGKARWVEGKGQIYRKPDGSPEKVIGTVADITVRKQHEELVLRMSQDMASVTGASFHRSLVANLADALGANLAYVGGLEGDRDESIRAIAVYEEGRPGKPFIYPLKGTPCEEVLRAKLVAVPREASQTYPQDSAPFAKGYESYVGAKLRDRHGNPLGVLVVLFHHPVEDLELPKAVLKIYAERASTEMERMKAEESIRELNLKLEKRVADRTLELELANQELESFSYSVSHDLRAPLRAVDGFSQALVEDCGSQLQGECRDFLDKIRAAIRRMSQLIDDLLQLSRVNRKPIDRAPVDLSVMADQVMRSLMERHPDRKFDVHIQKNLSTEADPGLIRIALENLLENSVKFTRGREVARIRLEGSSDREQTVFKIIDNGAGFDSVYVNKLFSPFERLHGETEFEGTGIGLATVKRIVHRHGGRIWAEGTLNKGATFHFTFKPASS